MPRDAAAQRLVEGLDGGSVERGAGGLEGALHHGFVPSRDAVWRHAGAQLREATHPSIGAQDLRECLLLQLDVLHAEDPLVRTMIADHLEDITTNRLPRNQ